MIQCSSVNSFQILNFYVSKNQNTKMDRLKSIQTRQEGGGHSEESIEDDSGNSDAKAQPPPFMGLKVGRRAYMQRECIDGDYIGIDSDPYLAKLLSKQGDKTVLFADTVMRITGSGKLKRRILLITDFAIYLVDPETDSLKRRIALAAVDRVCMSELNDNFFAIIILTEYDLLMASTRKNEIVSVLIDATKSTTEELEVIYSNRYEYNAAADMVKEVISEEVDGGIKTRVAKK